jgi:hypothetical protein
MSSVSRKRTASVLSALVTMTLALGVAGLAATPASAASATEPQNVKLTWNGTTNLVATWEEPADSGGDPDEYYVHLEGEDADGNSDVDIDQFVPYVSGDLEYDFGNLLPKTNQYFVSIVLFDGVDGSGEYGYGDTPAFPLAATDIGLYSAGQNVTVYWTQDEDYSDTTYDVTLDGGSYHEELETNESTWADFTGRPRRHLYRHRDGHERLRRGPHGHSEPAGRGRPRRSVRRTQRHGDREQPLQGHRQLGRSC